MIEILHQVKKIRDGLQQLEALLYAHRERHQLGGGDALELDASQITSGRFPVSRLPDGSSGYILRGAGAGYDLVWDTIAGIAGTITDAQHGTKTGIPFAHHGDWGHYGKIPRTAPTGDADRCYVDGSNLYVHDGTSWILEATKDWNNLINKPSTFPPSAHASTHLSGGADAITGWISPSHIGPRSDTTTYTWFRTLNIAGTISTDHIFAPSTDWCGYLGNASYRWFISYIYHPYFWVGYAKGTGPTLFPVDAATHYTICPFTDGYSYVGTADYRFNLVRAITITSGDLGFEEDRCVVCGKPFKVNDSIVLKVRKIDGANRQILAVPVHAECNPHPLSEEMLKHHEEILKPRKNPKDELRCKWMNPTVSFEIVWMQPIDDKLMYVQAEFEDGITVCPIVSIEASEEEVVNALREAYIREKKRVVEEDENRRKGEEKLRRFGKSWKGFKGKVKVETETFQASIDIPR